MAHFQGEASDLIGRGQTVVKAHGAPIGSIADIARSALNQEEDRLRFYIGLAIRSDLDSIIIGQDQFKAHLGEGIYRSWEPHRLAFYLHDPCRGQGFEIVAQHNAVAAVGHRKTVAQFTACARRHITDLRAIPLMAVYIL